MFHKSTMKLTPKILLGGLAALILTAPLMADVTYTYTGNPFESFGGLYGPTDLVSGSFTVTSALGDSSPEATITPNSYSFTDGIQTISSTSPPPEVTFEVGTGLTGAITSWDISFTSVGGNILSTDSASSDFGEVGASLGENIGDPGGWVQSGGGASPVPEPGNLELIGLGLAAIVAARRKLQRSKA
jgi:PEP-CTERM motif